MIKPHNPNIKVIGVWWAWCTIINKMISEGLDGVNFIWINDNEHIDSCSATTKLDLWLKEINAFGWQWDYNVWEAAAEKHIWDIKQMLANTDMVLLVYSMWGRIWAWAWPIVAEVAKAMWILTIGIISKPFEFQHRFIKKSVWERIMKVEKSVDAFILIPNDDIYKNINNLSFKEAFGMMDNRSISVTRLLSNLVIKPGDIDIDFADVNFLMKDSWVWTIWTGYGIWKSKAIDATKQAIEDIWLSTDLSKAKKIFIIASGWDDFTPTEFREAATLVEEVIDVNIDFFWGMIFDERMKNETKINLLANS